MSKITISRLLESSRFVATKAGAELTDFIQAVADLVENTVRILTNGVGVKDNMDAIIKSVSIKHNTDTVVNTNGKTPLEVRPTYQLGNLTNMVSAFGWTINSSGQTVIRAKFDSATTAAIDITLVIQFS